MQLYIRNLIDNLNRGDNNSSRPKSVSLDGPPGIGKTHFVQRLGQILSLPVYSVSPNDLNRLFSYSYKLKGKPGLMDEALNHLYKTHQSSAGILLFDEFDKQIREDASHLIVYLLDITQQNTTKYQSDYLDLILPVNNTLFFFNCNSDFTANLSEKNKLAFNDRLEKWHFDPLGDTAKKDISLEFYQRALAEYKNRDELKTRAHDR